METPVFDFRDYKQFLQSWIETRPSKGRGARSALAHAAQCQPAYLSRVLNGNADLSLEQGLGACELLGLNDLESDYFLLLIQYSRAGTTTLKNRLQLKLNRAQSDQLNLKNRFQIKTNLGVEEQSTYYSAWYYAATHLLVSVPEYQTLEAISRKLHLPKQRVSRILEFLTGAGLATHQAGKFRIGTSRIHVGTDSPMLSKHHINWRLQAMKSLEKEPDEDLHYTAIVSLSHDDLKKLRSMLIKVIDEFNATVKRSPEETIQCLNLDFFGI